MIEAFESSDTASACGSFEVATLVATTRVVVANSTSSASSGEGMVDGEMEFSLSNSIFTSFLINLFSRSDR